MRFALLVVLRSTYQAMAQSATPSYSSMAPIEQYLMDRTAEIALARSAAPAKIKAARIPYQVPSAQDLPARVSGVLTVSFSSSMRATWRLAPTRIPYVTT